MPALMLSLLYAGANSFTPPYRHQLFHSSMPALTVSLVSASASPVTKPLQHKQRHISTPAQTSAQRNVTLLLLRTGKGVTWVAKFLHAGAHFVTFLLLRTDAWAEKFPRADACCITMLLCRTDKGSKSLACRFSARASGWRDDASMRRR